VQLQVVRANQRVDTAAIQVTVDNTPPGISITYPEQGQALTYSANRQVTIQAQASDNLSLAQVEFFMDGLSLGALDQAPFALTWTAARGSHTLRLVARDRAGNQSEETMDFLVN
jgi:chitinase